ncbi:hypothetical protein N656DRAFT_793947 [Canariomyces notabilis]|uniref:Uncharacterized protein n=1 Tax=Canariomyces notabilis TaxID=2074819 RepID=A0AAN6TNY6_9PEZI|nr:hypothetical protein N656DRAFT_793947 [Canariomyces arenarius]
MAYSSLVTLPPELLSEICSYLCSHCLRSPGNDRDPSEVESHRARIGTSEKQKEQADLLNLNRVCRVLHEVVEPFLYHHIHTSQNRDLYCAIRTLLSRFDLRTRVLDLRVDYDGSKPPALRPRDGLEEPVELRESADNGTLVSLLLKLVPRLQTFHLHVSDAALPPMDLLGSKFSLTSLRRLTFSVFERGFVLDRIVPVIQLAPNLEVLHCHGCTLVSEWFTDLVDGHIPIDDVPATSPPLRHLTELILTDTRMTAESLSNFLLAVGPKLSKVSMQRPEERPFDGDDVVMFDEVVAALQSWRSGLKELSFFSLDFCGQSEQAENTVVSSIPTSIRNLRIYGLNYNPDDLRPLLEAYKSGQFQYLRRIEIDGTDDLEEPLPLAFRQESRDLSAAFRSAGLEFIVHPVPKCWWPYLDP